MTPELAPADAGEAVSFPLTDRPWLPVIDLHGRPDTLSLRDVLLHAHELRWLDAESPSVTAALHRLLLAVLHDALQGPRTPDDWNTLWHAATLANHPHHGDDVECAVSSYLDRTATAFDLFDDEHPFLQCPALGGEKISTAAKLVHTRSVGNNTTLFDHTTTTADVLLDPAEAARWLVTVQAFDPGGTKTPFTTVKKSQQGVGNNFGTTLIEGSTLKETLLLNLVLYDPNAHTPLGTREHDRPVWRDEPSQPEPDTRNPRGWLDLLTWPARRVLLRPAQRDGHTVVDGVLVTPGTSLTPSQLRDIEQMAAFHQAAKSSKKAEPPPWYPVQLHEMRGVWRHARELLLASTRGRQRPQVLDHVAARIGDDILSREQVFTLRVFGQQLDRSGGGSVYTWLQEQLPAPAALLRADSPTLELVLGYCVELADTVGDRLTELRKHYRQAFNPAARSPKRRPPRDPALEENYWPGLTAPFATFLRELGAATTAETSPRALTTTWKHTVRSSADSAVGLWTEQIQQGQSRHLDTIAKLYEWFRVEVNRACRTFDRNIDACLPDEDDQ